MALRQTYLSLKNKLPKDAEYVLVMRRRGNVHRCLVLPSHTGAWPLLSSYDCRS